MRFEVFIAVNILSKVFWDVTPSILVDIYHFFRNNRGEDDQFVLIMKAVYGIAVRKRGPSFVAYATHLTLLYLWDLRF
jgi:hypothetical protein